MPVLCSLRGRKFTGCKGRVGVGTAECIANNWLPRTKAIEKIVHRALRKLYSQLPVFLFPLPQIFPFSCPNPPPYPSSQFTFPIADWSVTDHAYNGIVL
jgi:hypothetical protein